MTGSASLVPGVRRYEAGDRADCLRLFSGNVPQFFTADEESAYAAFLDDLPGPYLVLERDGVVVAAGGYAYDTADTVALCWGMVDASRHGAGLGRTLLDARLAAIRRDPALRRVRISTSQRTAGFFGRAGFVTVDVWPGALGPGLDRVDMVLDLAGG